MRHHNIGKTYHLFTLAMPLGLCLALVPACKKIGPESAQSGADASKNRVFVESSEKPEDITIEAAEKSPLVDGSRLIIQSLQASAQAIGSHKSLALTAEVDPSADVLQFYACQKEEPFSCNPSKENPGMFVAGVVSFPSPPAGLLEIGVRACVRNYNLQSGSDPCGPWKASVYKQEANLDEKLSALLVEEYQQENRIRDLGGDIRKELVAYQQQASSLGLAGADKNHENFGNLVQNLLTLGEDIGGEFLLGDELSDIELALLEQQSQSQSLGLAESGFGSEGSIAGMAIMSLGSLAVLGGAGLVLKDSFNSEIKKNALATLELKKIENLKVAIENVKVAKELSELNQFKNQINYEKVRKQWLIELANKKYSGETLNRKLDLIEMKYHDLDGHIKRTDEMMQQVKKNNQDLTTRLNEVDSDMKKLEVETKGSSGRKIAGVGAIVSVVGAVVFASFQLASDVSPEAKLLASLEPIYDQLSQDRLNLLEIKIKKIEYLNAIEEE